MQFALMNFADQSFHSHPYIVDNRLVDRVRDDRVFRRTEQQITAIRSDARIGAESLYRQVFDYLDGPIVRVTGRDAPMPYARDLEDAAIPDADQVVAAAHQVLYRT